MKPVVREVLSGGSIVEAVQGKAPLTKKEKQDFWGQFGSFGDAILDRREN